LYRRALALYHDDYLIAEARYDDWAIAERERLLALYLRAADRLASELVARGAFDEGVAWCEKILARDRCWEHAYRLLMRAYAQRGDRAQVRRVFEQCARVLREELDVEPSEATVEVYKQVVSG
jgi:DNA-binding SARP family transcriptional activator